MNQQEAQAKYAQLQAKIKATEKPGLTGIAAKLERMKLMCELENFVFQTQQLWNINLLEPCPFCGSYSIELKVHDCEYGSTYDYCLCLKCEAEGPPQNSKELAISLWNTRAS